MQDNASLWASTRALICQFNRESIWLGEKAVLLVLPFSTMFKCGVLDPATIRESEPFFPSFVSLQGNRDAHVYEHDPVSKWVRIAYFTQYLFELMLLMLLLKLPSAELRRRLHKTANVWAPESKLVINSISIASSICATPYIQSVRVFGRLIRLAPPRTICSTKYSQQHKAKDTDADARCHSYSQTPSHPVTHTHILGQRLNA